MLYPCFLYPCCCLCLLLFLLPEGDCYLMEWSDWSSCASVCVKGAALDYVPVQVRSRAVLAQEPENLQLCPDQQWESRPCTGQVSPVPDRRVPLMIAQLEQWSKLTTLNGLFGLFVFWLKDKYVFEIHMV